MKLKYTSISQWGLELDSTKLSYMVYSKSNLSFSAVSKLRSSYDECHIKE